jgi:hypothetical protein
VNGPGGRSSSLVAFTVAPFGNRSVNAKPARPRNALGMARFGSSHSTLHCGSAFASRSRPAGAGDVEQRQPLQRPQGLDRVVAQGGVERDQHGERREAREPPHPRTGDRRAGQRHAGQVLEPGEVPGPGVGHLRPGRVNARQPGELADHLQVVVGHLRAAVEEGQGFLRREQRPQALRGDRPARVHEPLQRRERGESLHLVRRRARQLDTHEGERGVREVVRLHGLDPRAVGELDRHLAVDRLHEPTRLAEVGVGRLVGLHADRDSAPRQRCVQRLGRVGPVELRLHEVEAAEPRQGGEVRHVVVGEGAAGEVQQAELRERGEVPGAAGRQLRVREAQGAKVRGRGQREQRVVAELPLNDAQRNELRHLRDQLAPLAVQPLRPGQHQLDEREPRDGGPPLRRHPAGLPEAEGVEPGPGRHLPRGGKAGERGVVGPRGVDAAHPRQPGEPLEQLDRLRREFQGRCEVGQRVARRQLRQFGELPLGPPRVQPAVLDELERLLAGQRLQAPGGEVRWERDAVAELADADQFERVGRERLARGDLDHRAVDPEAHPGEGVEVLDRGPVGPVAALRLRRGLPLPRCCCRRLLLRDLRLGLLPHLCGDESDHARDRQQHPADQRPHREPAAPRGPRRGRDRHVVGDRGGRRDGVRLGRVEVGERVVPLLVEDDRRRGVERDDAHGVRQPEFDGPQFLGRGLGRRRPVRRVLREQPHHEVGQVRGHRRVAGDRRVRVVDRQGREDGEGVRAAERQLAGGHLV